MLPNLSTRRRKLLLALGVAVACVLIAVGYEASRRDDPARATGPGSGVGSSDIKPPETGVAQINGQYYVNGTPVPWPTEKPEPRSTETFDYSSPLHDFINVMRDYNEDECNLRRGVQCRIKFKGNVFLGSDFVGKIRIVALENDKKEAAVRVLEPATKGRNTMCGWEQCPYGGAFIDYTPSLNAQKVVFVFELYNEQGKLLISDGVQELPIRA